MDFSIGVSREQAKAVEMNGDQFICPSCRGIVIISFEIFDINRKYSEMIHDFEHIIRYITFNKII
jgi:hypothetical protein